MAKVNLFITTGSQNSITHEQFGCVSHTDCSSQKFTSEYPDHGTKGYDDTDGNCKRIAQEIFDKIYAKNSILLDELGRLKIEEVCIDKENHTFESMKTPIAKAIQNHLDKIITEAKEKIKE